MGKLWFTINSAVYFSLWQSCILEFTPQSSAIDSTAPSHSPLLIYALTWKRSSMKFPTASRRQCNPNDTMVSNWMVLGMPLNPIERLAEAGQPSITPAS